MKLIENMNVVYYIVRRYRYNGISSTFVRVKSRKGSKLYRCGYKNGMFFENLEVCRKYMKKGDEIRKVDLGKEVYLERNKEDRNILEIKRYSKII